MLFEMGYYVNQEGEIMYFNCLAIDSKTHQELVVYMDSNRVNQVESKSVWSKQFQRCENQLDACQEFQKRKYAVERMN